MSLTAGANTGAKTRGGWCAVHNAANQGHFRVVRALMNHDITALTPAKALRTFSHYNPTRHDTELESGSLIMTEYTAVLACCEVRGTACFTILLCFTVTPFADHPSQTNNSTIIPRCVHQL